VLLPMMMSFICSYRNKVGAKLHIYLEEGTYPKRLFRGTSTNDDNVFYLFSQKQSRSQAPIYIEECTYQKRLFRGTITKDMKK
jgi:hypothetical protein